MEKFKFIKEQILKADRINQQISKRYELCFNATEQRFELQKNDQILALFSVDGYWGVTNYFSDDAYPSEAFQKMCLKISNSLQWIY